LAAGSTAPALSLYTDALPGTPEEEEEEVYLCNNNSKYTQMTAADKLSE